MLCIDDMIKLVAVMNEAHRQVLFPSAREQGLDTSGLTETANFGLPDGSLDTGSPLEPFDWSAAPPLPQPDPQEEPHLEPGECSTVPEELVACQRDAPEPLKVTPSRSG